MDDEVDVAHRHLEARLIAHVADEEAQRAFLRMAGEVLRHFVLLELVAREDD